MITRNELWSVSAGCILADTPEDDFFEMSYEDQTQWCEYNVCEVLEGAIGEWLWETINDHTDAVIDFLNQKGIEVEA